MSLSKTVVAALLMVSAASAQQQPQAPPPPPAPPAPVPQILQNYKPVTTERLKNPEDADWLTIRRTYDGWGHSPLKQITTGNVNRLQPVWVLTTGQVSGHEAPPIVNNGVMFVATPGNQVIALDAKAGTILWRYRRPLADDAIVLHRTSRGVALYGDKVFFAAADAVLVALDARTGKEVWTTKVEENKNGYYMTAAPLVADGKVLVGISGGELGIRGFVAAYNVDTGAEAWKAFMVPAPGEPGSETWPKGDQWKTGGAADLGDRRITIPRPIWSFWGTGNGGPWMGDQRPGDNLYTASTVAIDVATGQIKGHFQYQPNESWDWDEVSPPILVDFRRNGRTIKRPDQRRAQRLPLVPRAHERQDQLRRRQALREAERLQEPRSRRPDGRTSIRTTSLEPARWPSICPSLSGGKNWPPIAFSPETRMIYIPANENHLRNLDRAGSRVRPGPQLHRRVARLLRSARRRPFRRSAGVERRYRPAGVDPPLPEIRSTGVRCSPRAAGWCSAAAPTIGCSARSTPRTEKSCGSFRPTPACSARRRHSRSTASSTSPCSPAGALTRGV